jgi:predicted ATP-dependent protease
MLKAGSLSRANGGYLLLDIKDVLTNPGVWDALKRAIRTKEVRIEDPFEQFGLIAPVGMRPEPMPMDVKVIIIGDAHIYQLLAGLDEEFWELFRVKADFDYEMDRNQVNMEAYACFITRCCDDEKLLPFDASGVAKVLEYAARVVADQEKLSARFGLMKEVAIEADYWARRAGNSVIDGTYVRQAIDKKIFRHNLIDEKVRELVDRGTIKIDVVGTCVGQVNGLSIYSLGDLIFGRPSRITAKTFIGRGGVVNIEREAQLSGPTHNKGVLILGGYFGWKFAQDKPLSLSASLCFEQSYEGVDGDSASSAELYAILSALSETPIKQSIAVTGSINQTGEVQAIGGVNHKIEGFFRVCEAKGLTGDQGVIIPTANTSNLMLHEDVVEAVSQGKFHIYAVSNVDEGIEVLTGQTAGERRKNGSFPQGTLNRAVDRRLREMSESFKKYQPETTVKTTDKSEPGFSIPCNQPTLKL